jgi:hypothetical protein
LNKTKIASSDYCWLTKGKIMKKVILTMTVLGLAVAGMQTAKAGNSFSFGLSIGGSGYAASVGYAAPAPYYNYCPPPRVVYAPPVYCAPPPVVVYRAPAYWAPASVCAAPAPVFSHRYGYGGEHHRYSHGR